MVEMSAQSALTSPAQYLISEETASVRHEFVAGLIYAMSGASRNHVEITRALSGLLFRETTGKPCRNLDQDTKVWVDQSTSYYYPDATISCPPNFIDEKHGVIDNPTVVFEVLSPTTANLDRGPKFAAYRTLESLREFVVIESEAARVEVFSLEEGLWVVRFFSGLEALATIPSVGITLPLTELYRHTVFESAEA
jgi:Uma2 family endonuclease